jgi:lipoate-protein ligase B
MNANTLHLPTFDLGRMPYMEAWECQRQWAGRIERENRPGVVLTVEHPSVLTVGRSAGPMDLGDSIEGWTERGVEVVETDRGGKVTYHGPGQIVLYPILDLRHFGSDLRSYIYHLEQTGIEMLGTYGIDAVRDPEHTGVWVGSGKVAAIGVHVRRWIAIHGMSANINVDLSIYDRFTPCGISDRSVASLHRLLGVESVDIAEGRGRLLEAFESVFGVRLDESNTMTR